MMLSKRAAVGRKAVMTKDPDVVVIRCGYCMIVVHNEQIPGLLFTINGTVVTVHDE